MSMNRQQRRHLQKQGELGADGAPAPQRRRQASAPPPDRRTSPAEFASEVRAELKKVSWPTREELINYSIVVFITIVVLTAIIAGMDYLSGEAVFRLFSTN